MKRRKPRVKQQPSPVVTRHVEPRPLSQLEMRRGVYSMASANESDLRRGLKPTKRMGVMFAQARKAMNADELRDLSLRMRDAKRIGKQRRLKPS